MDAQNFMDKLGINLTLILFQVINFFVLMFVLKKFLYKPILSMFDKRRENIEKTEALRQELDKEKGALGDEKAKLLAEAREEADALLSDVHKQTGEIKRRAEEEAKKQADHIIARAEDDALTLEAQLRQELSEEAKKTALSVAEKVLHDTITDQQRSQILEQTAKEFAQS